MSVEFRNQTDLSQLFTKQPTTGRQEDFFSPALLFPAMRKDNPLEMRLWADEAGQV